MALLVGNRAGNGMERVNLLLNYVPTAPDWIEERYIVVASEDYNLTFRDRQFTVTLTTLAALLSQVTMLITSRNWHIIEVTDSQGKLLAIWYHNSGWQEVD